MGNRSNQVCQLITTVNVKKPGKPGDGVDCSDPFGSPGSNEPTPSYGLSPKGA